MLKRIACVGVLAASLAACGEPSQPISGGGPPAQLSIVSGDAQQVEVGTELPQPVVVRLTDDAGDPVVGFLVNFRVVSGGGSVFAGAALTNANGEARERWTIGTSTSEVQRLEARALDPTTGAPLVFGFFTAVPKPAAPSAITIVSGNDQDGGITEPLPQPLVVRVVDQFSNAVPGVGTQWSTKSLAGTLPATVVTNDDGLASASWILGPNPMLDSATVSVNGTIPPARFAARAHVFYSQIAVGNTHACALSRTGVVYCWGSHTLGQLGIGVSPETCPSDLSRPCSTRPRPVTLPAKAVQVASVGRHTCALTDAGGVYCWGENRYGQLGSSTTETCIGVACSSTPRLVPGLTAKSLATGDGSTCALTVAGVAYCWGANGLGQLGTGDTVESSSPRIVIGGHVFAQLAMQTYTTCGLLANGELWCWGGNGGQQFGFKDTTVMVGATNETRSVHSTPLAVQSTLRFDRIALGWMHVCGLTGTAVQCWGRNVEGALGLGFQSFEEFPAPQPPVGGVTFSAIQGSMLGTCGITSSHAAYCWGKNDGAQLGIGYRSDANGNYAVPSPTSLGPVAFSSVVVTSLHGCGISVAGAAYCWGYPGSGKLGQGIDMGAVIVSPTLVLDPP